VAIVLVTGACKGGADRSAAPAPPPTSPATTTATTPTTLAAPTPPSTTAAAPSGPGAALKDPARAKERAPERFRVRFETTKGPFVVEVQRAWAPRGADRFYNLVKAGFFDEITFFRVVPGFMVQFGIHGSPKVAAAWREAQIQDDPVKQSNKRGAITFATAGPNTRTTQIFINFKDNTFLDGQGFAPFGSVVEGMDVVDSLYSGYGEGAPRGAGPDQGRAQMEGNAYFRRDFPKLDSVKAARLVTAKAAD
jgi:peptidyl-prolyl cis-trans isomerase A (cyclophilin A)